MATDDKHRMNTMLPAYYIKKLRLWSWAKGTSPTTLANNILQARIEANAELIEEMLTDRAKDLGISLEELIDKILNNNEDGD